MSKVIRDAIVHDILHLGQWSEIEGNWFQTETNLLIRYAAAMMPETDFVLCKGNAFHHRKHFKVTCTEYYYSGESDSILLGDDIRVYLRNATRARAYVTENEWVMFNLSYSNKYWVNMVFQP